MARRLFSLPSLLIGSCHFLSHPLYAPTSDILSSVAIVVFDQMCQFPFYLETPAPFLQFERFWPTASCHLLMQSISLSSTLMSNGFPNQLQNRLQYSSSQEYIN